MGKNKNGTTSSAEDMTEQEKKAQELAEQKRKAETMALKQKKDDRLNLKLAIIVIVINFATTIIAVLWIFTNLFCCWKNSMGILYSFGIQAEIVSDMFFAGVLGGALYCMRGMYIRLPDAYTSDPSKTTKPLNMKGWFLWYLYRPLQGGVLALILLVLTKSNLLKIDEAGGTDANSLFFLIGIGFLAGFGASELTDKIEAIIQAIFGKKDNNKKTDESDPNAGKKDDKEKKDKKDNNTNGSSNRNAPAKSGSEQPKAEDANSGTNAKPPKPEEDNGEGANTPTKQEPEESSTEEGSSTEEDSPTDLPKDK